VKEKAFLNFFSLSHFLMWRERKKKEKKERAF
jgi:preprotein translocase subunit YajC